MSRASLLKIVIIGCFFYSGLTAMETKDLVDPSKPGPKLEKVVRSRAKRSPVRKEIVLTSDSKTPLNALVIKSAALSHNGKYAALGTVGTDEDTGGVSLIDLSSGCMAYDLEGHEFTEDVDLLQFSRDNQFIIAQSSNDIAIWCWSEDAKRYSLFDLRLIDPAVEALTTTAISPDTKTLVTGGDKGTFVICHRGLLEGGTGFFPVADEEQMDIDRERGQFCQAYADRFRSGVAAFNFLTNNLVQIILENGDIHLWDITAERFADEKIPNLRQLQTACAEPYTSVLSKSIPVIAQIKAWDFPDRYGNSIVLSHITSKREGALNHLELGVYGSQPDGNFALVQLFERIEDAEQLPFFHNNFYVQSTDAHGYTTFVVKKHGITKIRVWDNAGHFLGVCELDETEELASAPICDGKSISFIIETAGELKFIQHDFLNLCDMIVIQQAPKPKTSRITDPWLECALSFGVKRLTFDGDSDDDELAK